MNKSILVLSRQCGELLRQQGARVSTAESCTGGWVAQAITAVAGSSDWFDVGFVTYSNLAKQQVLQVPAALLEGPQAPGAVSQETVLAREEEGRNRLSALRDALGVLNPRERRIFEARRLADDPITLEDLSGEFGVSRERVRQIEVRAFEKVQEAVKRNLATRELPRTEARIS